MKLFIGLMSGTSMDGIDAALVDVTINQLIMGITRTYSDGVQQFLQEVLSGERVGIPAICQLNTIIGREFALAANQLLQAAKLTTRDVVAIGSHGQTLAHDATSDIPYTLQVSCPHTIAKLTGLTVVADFRTRDLIAGGQGAPLAPIYHQALFGSANHSIAVVNIGGIANVSFLDHDGQIRGYDTGPGNCLMDAWIKQHLGKAHDVDGVWAASGQVIIPLLSALLDDPYFKLPPPKSIGKEYFSERWLLNYLTSEFSKNDVQATLLALTASTIGQAIRENSLQVKRVMLCGGGSSYCQILCIAHS